jgi:hypothetical protein
MNSQPEPDADSASGLDEPSGEVRRGAPTNIVEAVVACLIVLMGVVIAQSSWQLGAGWQTDGPGAGYFPFYIGIILCLSGLGILLPALFGKKKNREIFVDNVQLSRVLSVLVPALVYVLAVQFIGLYVASALYIALFMIVLGKYSPFKSIAIALAVVIVLFVMFEVWFRVPLYKGMFDLLSPLGY